MTIPCCYPNPNANWPGELPHRCYEAQSEYQCIHESPFGAGTPGPEGTSCYDPNNSQNGCYSCDPRGFEFTVGCCFPGDIWHQTWESNCSECGGFLASEDECHIPLPPPECREPEDDRPDPDGRRWTIDLIGTAAFGYGEDVGQDGLTKPVTANTIRARPARGTEDDSCAHTVGRYVILEDGCMYVEVCSKPTGNPDSERVSYAGLMTAEGEERLDEGCQYFMGGIHLPWWTEANLRSHQYRCGGIPV